MKHGAASMKRGWVITAIVLSAMISGPVAFAAEREVHFKVPHPFRVGNHIYDAGVIAIKNVSAYTPSIALLRVWVNGECLGMMTAHRSVSEVPPTESEALFRRDDDGRLVMVGFRVTGRPTGATYRFPDPHEAAALISAQTDLASAISPETARATASSSGTASTVSTSSASRLARVGVRSNAR